jgi:hypothetical protein
MPRSRLPICALLVFTAGLALLPMSESDLFFRLEAGREILAHHALPSRNLFSFTYPDYPDLDLSWLFEVGAALIQRAWGIGGVVIAKTLVVTATIGAAFWLCRRRGSGPLGATLALAAAVTVMQERLVERPHIFSFAGEIGLLCALELLETAGAGRRRRRAWLTAGLLAGVALWANFHAGVFMAPVLLGLYAIGAAFDRREARRRVPGGPLPPAEAPGREVPASGAAWRAALLAAGACGAMLLTPVGVGIFRYLALHVRIPRLHAVDEFRAASLESDGALLLYASLLVVALALGGRRRLRVRQLLPALGLGLLAWRTIRFGADFALLAAPLLASAGSAAAARFAERIPAVLRGRAPLAGVSALLLGLALGPRLGAARQGRPLVDVGLDTAALPLEAIRFVEENGLRERMYNDFEIGAYLAFEGYPRYRVFIDPRLPAYPPEFHQLMGRADLSRGEWDRAMERYGVQSALLAYAGLNRRVAWWDPARWALVYRQHDARVFVRRLPKWRALIAAREIPASFDFTVEEGTATVPLDAPPAASPVPACEWQRRLGDLLLELDEGNPTRALVAYRRALQGPPGCLGAADQAALRGWMTAPPGPPAPPP